MRGIRMGAVRLAYLFQLVHQIRRVKLDFVVDRVEAFLDNLVDDIEIACC